MFSFFFFSPTTILPIVLAFVTAYKFKEYRRMTECKVRLKGKVIDIEKRDVKFMGLLFQTIYTFYVRYTYEGQEYESPCFIKTKSQCCGWDETVDICINPNTPKDMYILRVKERVDCEERPLSIFAPFFWLFMTFASVFVVILPIILLITWR